MAFDTQPASGSTPVQFVGTDGVDAIAINSTNTFILTGLGGNDVVNSGTTVENSLVSLGDDDDIFTGNITGGGTIISSRLNGNAGNDTIGNPAVGLSVTASANSIVNPLGIGTGILGGQGDDIIYLTFMQSSRANGNLGDDQLWVGVPGGVPTNVSDSQVFGGQGNDIINANGSGLPNDTSYFNTILGGNLGDDTVFLSTAGTVQNVTIEGGEGNDSLTVNGYEDLNNDGIFDPVGQPTEFATFNNVIVNGGSGDDVVDIFNLRNGTLTVNGGEGNDSITALGNPTGLTLNGDEGDDTISGSFGSDTIDGGIGDDILFGGSGNDSLSGGDGNDQITGGFGSDTLRGGTGNNVFVQQFNSTGAVTFNNEFGGAFMVNGESFTIIGGADVIEDWAAGSVNQINTGVSGLDADADATLSNGRAWSFGPNPENYAFRGTYSGTTFTIDNNGSDIGVVTKTGNSLFAFGDNFTVLRDAGGLTLNAADFVV